jgi:hypothetical protein
MTAPTYARISKTDPRRVVCGYVAPNGNPCGNVVAYLHQVNPPDKPPLWLLYFERGMQIVAGVWTRDPQNVQRVQQRQELAGNLHLYTYLSMGGWARKYELPAAFVPPHPTTASFPVRVRCPAPDGCGTANVVDPAVLGVPVTTEWCWSLAQAGVVCRCCPGNRLRTRAQLRTVPAGESRVQRRQAQRLLAVLYWMHCSKPTSVELPRSTQTLVALR